MLPTPETQHKGNIHNPNIESIETTMDVQERTGKKPVEPSVDLDYMNSGALSHENRHPKGGLHDPNKESHDVQMDIVQEHKGLVRDPNEKDFTVTPDAQEYSKNKVIDPPVNHNHDGLDQPHATHKKHIVPPPEHKLFVPRHPSQEAPEPDGHPIGSHPPDGPGHPHSHKTTAPTSHVHGTPQHHHRHCEGKHSNE